MGIFRINTGDERNHYVIHLALSNFLMVDYTLSKEAVLENIVFQINVPDRGFVYDIKVNITYSRSPELCKL